jgi:hypothetical protein
LWNEIVQENFTEMSYLKDALGMSKGFKEGEVRDACKLEGAACVKMIYKT